jgi:tetratricopeptide (TPR) repeat protein
MKVILALVLLLSGCASLRDRYNFSKEHESLEQTQQRELNSILELSEKGQNEKALQEIGAFHDRYKETPYYQASRLVEAKILYNMQDFAPALAIYEDIISLGPEKNPEIWAQARYESTFCNEATGEEFKALSILVGLEKSKAPLREEVALAELPARMASLYARLGREKETLDYLDKADRGLKFLVQKKGANPDKKWLAETLFRMGQVTRAPLSAGNFIQQVQSHRRSQIYLLKAMEQNVPLWSEKASDELIKEYREQWNFIQSHWNNFDEEKNKGDHLKDLHRLLSESMYKKPVEPELWNPYLKNYYAFATSLEKQVVAQLYSGNNLTLMTPESDQLNSIKRSGKVKATQALPEEKQQAPTPTRKDPNL